MTTNDTLHHVDKNIKEIMKQHVREMVMMNKHAPVAVIMTFWMNIMKV